jgi:hypothetical protein
MRVVVLLLLLANLGFFAWSQGWLAGAGLGPDTQREPQRLAAQVRPGQLQVVPLPAASAPPSGASAAASAPAPAASPARAASAASAPASAPAHPAAPASAASKAQPTATAKSAAVCREIGPFGAMETAVLAQAQTAIAAAGLHAVAIKTPVPPQWMVWLGPLSGPGAVQKQLAQLAQSKVKVYAAVTDRPRYEPGISLGVFGSADLANQQLQIVEKQGVTGATVVPRNAGLDRTLLRLPGLTPAQLATVDTIAARLKGQTVKACTP